MVLTGIGGQDLRGELVLSLIQWIPDVVWMSARDVICLCLDCATSFLRLQYITDRQAHKLVGTTACRHTRSHVRIRKHSDDERIEKSPESFSLFAQGHTKTAFSAAPKNMKGVDGSFVKNVHTNRESSART